MQMCEVLCEWAWIREVSKAYYPKPIDGIEEGMKRKKEYEWTYQL